MKQISFKLGVYFLICVTLLEMTLFALLYYSLVNTRVEEEVTALLARGNSHRDVLEKYYDAQTITHVALMESEAETKVVITTPDKKILAKSNSLDAVMQSHVQKKLGTITSKGTVIENHWKTSNYICTVSPIRVQGELKGYVYMFLGTYSIETMIARLTKQFLVIALVTFLLTVATIFILSRLLTKPLVRMKHATEKLSKGNLSVALHMKRNDEVGELAHSIQTLADDLHYLKQERSEFLASVAHELRTPLTYVRGYADIAMRETLSNEERNTYLAIIKDETDHIAGLVEDLFELAQMDRHAFVIEKKETNLSPFLEKIINKVQLAYEDKYIYLHLVCPAQLFVFIDEQRFEQVIVNLLHNAYFHSSSHKTITITVTTDKDTVHIAVADEGEGIPEADIPHIFERFYRVDKSRTRATGGSGLGLAIIKEIIELHNGTITVQSTLGKGSIFTIALQKGADPKGT